MKSYVATYTFDGRGWIVQFEEPDIATFGRALATAKVHARSLLAVWLEVDDLTAAGAEVIDHVKLPAAAQIDVGRLSRQRVKAEAVRRDLAADTRSAARALRAAGLSTRDVGEILGISGARVAQMDHEPPGPQPPRRDHRTLPPPVAMPGRRLSDVLREMREEDDR